MTPHVLVPFMNDTRFSHTAGPVGGELGQVFCWLDACGAGNFHFDSAVVGVQAPIHEFIVV